MNEIKVGEFVRTKDGYIAKCTYIGNVLDFDNTVRVDWGEEHNFLYPSEDYILKHSPNIIDVLEEGDYVNDYRIEEIGETHRDKVKYVIDSLDRSIYSENIKSIVTHEQMDSMKYIVGGKEE